MILYLWGIYYLSSDVFNFFDFCFFFTFPIFSDQRKGRKKNKNGMNIKQKIRLRNVHFMKFHTVFLLLWYGDHQRIIRKDIYFILSSILTVWKLKSTLIPFSNFTSRKSLFLCLEFLLASCIFGYYFLLKAFSMFFFNRTESIKFASVREYTREFLVPLSYLSPEG